MCSDENLIERLIRRNLDPSRRNDAARFYQRPIYPPTTYAVICEFERRSDIEFDRMLSRIYTEVGNGGFGPGPGLLGIFGGHSYDDNKFIYDIYNDKKEEFNNRNMIWPASVVPVCTYGQDIWACVDCSVKSGDIVVQLRGSLTRTKFGLRAWLAEWLSGQDVWSQMLDFEVFTGINPFTKQLMPVSVPRAAQGDVMPVLTRDENTA